jgi:hypothetical protein
MGTSKNMKGFFIFYLAAFFLPANSFAQEYPLVLGKQGSFKVTDWGAYTHYDCGYTKAETSANYQKVLAVINAIKKSNLVLNELKGFDAELLLFAQQCDPKFGYGIPSRLTIGFCSWIMFKGKEVRNKIEPPAWYINFNVLGNVGSQSYESKDRKKPVTQKEKWEEAGRRLSELVYTTGTKETLAPGIDRYNGQDIVIYNPDRPPYWLPITVREMYKLTYDYWRLEPDSIARELGLKMLDAEYSTFTEEELDGYAYSMGKGALARVGNDKDSPQIMKPNPAYWNKNLPKSTIQIIRFILPANKTYLQSTVDEYLKANSISYHEARFELTLDVFVFASLIDK